MPYASAPIAPRPKINPNAAAAISDEDNEEAADRDEDGMVDDAASQTPANGNGVKSVIMTVPQSRQADGITRPVAPDSSQTPGAQDSQRPRRVHATKP
jgi:hypothetical protein